VWELCAGTGTNVFCCGVFPPPSVTGGNRDGGWVVDCSCVDDTTTGGWVTGCSVSEWFGGWFVADCCVPDWLEDCWLVVGCSFTEWFGGR
jgi:hypothetical protein